MPSALTLAVFAKSPVPGRVKTRLCPPLTDVQAARLYAAFVHDTVRKFASPEPLPSLVKLAPPSPFRGGQEKGKNERQELYEASDTGFAACDTDTPPSCASPAPFLSFSSPTRDGEGGASFTSDGRGSEYLGPPTLYFSGDPTALQDLLADLPPVAWQSQSGGDLGARMARVPAPCLIVGTDSPHLPLGIVQEALDALESHDVVLGPAEDGGYYLIALRAPQPALFSGVAWSTPDVLAQTLARSAENGLSVHLLPPFYDIDTAADLTRLHSDLAAGLVSDCPATQAVLEEFVGAKFL